eukprot:g31428.t1
MCPDVGEARYEGLEDMTSWVRPRVEEQAPREARTAQISQENVLLRTLCHNLSVLDQKLQQDSNSATLQQLREQGLTDAEQHSCQQGLQKLLDRVYQPIVVKELLILQGGTKQ